MARIVQVESSGNPFAIGVVAGRLQRQPRDLDEAVETAKSLEREGYNYSVGLSQINRVHFNRLGWAGDIAKGFDACRNLHAGADVYARCKQGAERSFRAGDATSVLRAALSCYYSGNFVTGERTGYVDKVLGTSTDSPRTQPVSPRSFRSMFD